MKNSSRLRPHRLFAFFASCGLAFVVGIAAAAGAQDLGGNAEAKKKVNPVKPTAESIAAGDKLFQKNCGFCHGKTGKGDGELAPKDTHPADLTDKKWDRGSSDGEIFAVIEKGAGPKFDMKGFRAKMSDEDIWNVVNYIRSLGPKNAK